MGRGAAYAAPVSKSVEGAAAATPPPPPPLPSGLLAKGVRVVIHSLQKSARHNGIEATVQRFDEEKGRYVVRAVVEPNKKPVRILVTCASDTPIPPRPPLSPPPIAITLPLKGTVAHQA